MAYYHSERERESEGGCGLKDVLGGRQGAGRGAYLNQVYRICNDEYREGGFFSQLCPAATASDSTLAFFLSRYEELAAEIEGLAIWIYINRPDKLVVSPFPLLPHQSRSSQPSTSNSREATRVCAHGGKVLSRGVEKR